MKHTQKIALHVLAATTVILLVSASVWEGAAIAASAGELPDSGLYVATNSFPRNTIVDITNLETGKTARVIVADGIRSPGLMAIVSKEASERIGLQSRSMGRIRMTMPADPIAFSRFTDNGTSEISKDPDRNPEAAVAQKAAVSAAAVPAVATAATVVATPTAGTLASGAAGAAAASSAAASVAPLAAASTAAAPSSAAPSSAAPKPASAPAAAPEVPKKVEPVPPTAPKSQETPRASGVPPATIAPSVEPVKEPAKEPAQAPAAKQPDQVVETPTEEIPTVIVDIPESYIPPAAPVPVAPPIQPAAVVELQPVEVAPETKAEPIAEEPTIKVADDTEPTANDETVAAVTIVSATVESPAAIDNAAVDVDVAVDSTAAMAAEDSEASESEPADPLGDAELAMVPAEERPPEHQDVELPPEAEIAALPTAPAVPRVAETQAAVPEARIEPDQIIPAIPERPVADRTLAIPESTTAYILAQPILPAIPSIPAPMVDDAAVEDAPELVIPVPAAPFRVPVVKELEKGKYYLQLGAYTKPETVQKELDKIGPNFPVSLQEGGNAESPVYRILVGPLNLGESGAAAQRFKSRGFKDAFIRQGN